MPRSLDSTPRSFGDPPRIPPRPQHGSPRKGWPMLAFVLFGIASWAVAIAGVLGVFG